MTVEVGFYSGHPECYLRNLRVSPYNRDDAIISFPLESAASSFLRLDNCKWCGIHCLNSGRLVYSNSLIPGPEMTRMTSFMSFDKIVWFTSNPTNMTGFVSCNVRISLKNGFYFTHCLTVTTRRLDFLIMYWTI